MRGSEASSRHRLGPRGKACTLKATETKEKKIVPTSCRLPISRHVGRYGAKAKCGAGVELSLPGDPRPGPAVDEED